MVWVGLDSEGRIISQERLISQLSSGQTAGAAELQAQVLACQQRVAAAAADIRSSVPPQMNDGQIVEEAIRRECLSSASVFPIICHLGRMILL